MIYTNPPIGGNQIKNNLTRLKNERMVTFIL